MTRGAIVAVVVGVTCAGCGEVLLGEAIDANPNQPDAAPGAADARLIDAPPGSADAMGDIDAASDDPRCGDGEINQDSEDCDDGTGVNGSPASLCTVNCISGRVSINVRNTFTISPPTRLRVANLGAAATRDVVALTGAASATIVAAYDFFQDSGPAATETFRRATSATGFTTFDIDGDGFDEIIWAESQVTGEPGPHVVRGDYSPVGSSSTSLGIYNTSMSGHGQPFGGNFDADSDIDVVVAERELDGSHVNVHTLQNAAPLPGWTNTYLGTTVARTDSAVTLFQAGGTPTRIQVMRHMAEPDAYMVHEVRADGTVTAGTETDSPVDVTRSIAVDFISNGARREEIVTLSPNGQVNIWVVMAGTTPTLTLFGTAMVNPRDVVGLDANDDGRMDALVLEPNGAVVVFINGGTNRTLQPQRFTALPVSEGFALAGGPDVTGDDAHDIVVSTNVGVHWIQVSKVVP